MLKTYNPAAWFWTVGNKPGVVFSSAAPGYIQPTDASLVSWLAEGSMPTPILCDGELCDVLIKAEVGASAAIAAGATSFGGLSASDATAVILAMGCAVVSTATPALNATYAIDTVSQGQITSESLYIQVTSGQGAAKFTNGQITKPWPDVAGAPHTFSTTQFIAFAEAVAQYVDGLQTGAASQPMTIA
jgi:hypothetical protein